MEINVRYNGRDYGTGGCSADSYKIELSQHESPGRPKGALFPDSSDTVRVEYKFNPAIMTSDRSDGDAMVVGTTLSLSVQEAEELAQLLIDSIKLARVNKAPVKNTLDRVKEMPTDGPLGDLRRVFGDNPAFVYGVRKSPPGK